VTDKLEPQIMSVKLSIAKVEKFENYIKRTYDGVVFELMVTHNLLVGTAIELVWIIVRDRKQGVGTSIMQELCEFADQHTAEIRLKPASKSDYAATTSRSRLVRFYKRFGFIIDRRDSNATGAPTLVRKPAI
jgi:hypothetical protein